MNETQEFLLGAASIMYVWHSQDMGQAMHFGQSGTSHCKNTLAHTHSRLKKKIWAQWHDNVYHTARTHELQDTARDTSWIAGQAQQILGTVAHHITTVQDIAKTVMAGHQPGKAGQGKILGTVAHHTARTQRVQDMAKGNGRTSGGQADGGTPHCENPEGTG